MKVRRTLLGDASFEPLPDDRTIRMVCSTESVGRDGVVLRSRGIRLNDYRLNPVWLWQHDPNQPVARSLSIEVDDAGRLIADVEFPPAGVSQKADEVLGLLRSKVIRGASTGFDEIRADWSDVGGTRAWVVEDANLLEMSFVSIPALADAVVARSAVAEAVRSASIGQFLAWFANEAGDYAASQQRSSMGLAPRYVASVGPVLPVVDVQDWSAADAVTRVFQAGDIDGDSPDMPLIQSAFLIYDAAAPLIRNSYHLPIGDIVDGKLCAVRTAIAAARALLNASDFTSSVKDSAARRLAEYEDGEMTERMQSTIKTRSLWELGCLAETLERLGWHYDAAQWEAEFADGGKGLPEILAKACRATADALLAMSDDEVRQLLARIAPVAPEAPPPVSDSADAGVQRFIAGWKRAQPAQPRSPTRARQLRQRMLVLLDDEST